MSSTLLERVKTWIAANDAASAAREAEIAEHGFEVNDERWTDVLALMPPVREIAAGLVASAAEVERLTAELEEARLTLAAEQGRAGGGPPGWVYEPGDEDFDEPGEWVNADRSLKVWRDNTFWVWGRRIANGAYQGPKRQPKDQTARAAMLAADAAHPSTPPASPE